MQCIIHFADSLQRYGNEKIGPECSKGIKKVVLFGGLVGFGYSVNLLYTHH